MALPPSSDTPPPAPCVWPPIRPPFLPAAPFAGLVLGLPHPPPGFRHHCNISMADQITFYCFPAYFMHGCCSETHTRLQHFSRQLTNYQQQQHDRTQYRFEVHGCRAGVFAFPVWHCRTVPAERIQAHKRRNMHNIVLLTKHTKRQCRKSSSN